MRKPKLHYTYDLLNDEQNHITSSNDIVEPERRFIIANHKFINNSFEPVQHSFQKPAEEEETPESNSYSNR